MPEATKPVEPKPYVQPPISCGEFVYWSFHKGNEKVLGLVTRNAGQTLNLTLFAENSLGVRTVTGARHVSDPMLKTMVEAPGGVWDYTEIGKKIHCLVD